MTRRHARGFVLGCWCLALVPAPSAGDEPARTIPTGVHQPSALAFSPDGRRLAVGGSGDSVGLLDVPTGRPLLNLGDKDRDRVFEVARLAFSPDGAILAMTNSSLLQTQHGPFDGLTAWGLPDGRRLARFPNLGGGLGPLKFSADGRSLHVDVVSFPGRWSLDFDTATWAKPGRAGVTREFPSDADPKAARHPKTFAEFRSWPREFPSPDGRVVAIADGGSVTVRDRDTGQERATARLAGSPKHVAFSPRGDRMAVGGVDGPTWLWDWADAAPRRMTDTPAKLLMFAPDGKTLAAAFGSGTVMLWDLAGMGGPGPENPAGRARSVLTAPPRN